MPELITTTSNNREDKGVLPDPPYPATTRVKGWRFELDMEQIISSDTWALCDPAIRPWLLMLWTTAWRQQPAGSLPGDHRLIEAHIGAHRGLLAEHGDVLLRGFVPCSDGRLYHHVVTARVLVLLDRRQAEKERKATYRKMSHGTGAGRTMDVRGVQTPGPEKPRKGHMEGPGARQKEGPGAGQKEGPGAGPGQGEGAASHPPLLRSGNPPPKASDRKMSHGTDAGQPWDVSGVRTPEPEPEPEPEGQEQDQEQYPPPLLRSGYPPVTAERSPNGSRLALEAMPDLWRDYCRTTRPDLDPDATWENFRDYWIAIPGPRGRKLDWYATWRAWVRREPAGRASKIRPENSIERATRIADEFWRNAGAGTPPARRDDGQLWGDVQQPGEHRGATSGLGVVVDGEFLREGRRKSA